MILAKSTADNTRVKLSSTFAHKVDMISISEDCCQGLCPTCLCEHTQQHTAKETQPKYENIRGTYTRVHESLSKQQSLITNDMNRLVNFDLIVEQNFWVHSRKERMLPRNPCRS